MSSDSAVRYRLVVLAGLLCVLATVLLVVVSVNTHGLAQALDSLGAWRGVAVAVLGALLVAVLVPAPLVAGACGLLLGTPTGTAVAIAALTVGGCLSAALGRRVGSERALRVLGARMARAAQWLEARPLRSIMVARVLGVPPFGIASYSFGLVRIQLRIVALGTAVGIAPRAFAYAALGGAVANFRDPSVRAALAAGIAVLVGVAAFSRIDRVLKRGDSSSR